MNMRVRHIYTHREYRVITFLSSRTEGGWPEYVAVLADPEGRLSVESIEQFEVVEYA